MLYSTALSPCMTSSTSQLCGLVNSQVLTVPCSSRGLSLSNMANEWWAEAGTALDSTAAKAIGPINFGRQTPLDVRFMIFLLPPSNRPFRNNAVHAWHELYFD